MFDLKKFWIADITSGVVKTYDRIGLTDRRPIPVPPGKYLKIYDDRSFGFEELTEEIGEKPDWDYDEPYCVVKEVTGFIRKTVRLKYRFSGEHEIYLCYGIMTTAWFAPVCRFRPGEYEGEVTFSYIDRDEALMACAGAGVAAGGAGYAVAKNVQTGLLLGGVVGGMGALLSLLFGD